MTYLAILVGAIASMSIGLLWFGPLFGKMWSEAMGFTPESKLEAKGAEKTYALSFLFEIITSYVLFQFFLVIGVTSVIAGLEIVALAWLGFVIPIEAGKVMWMGKPWKLFYLNSLHRLFSYCVMAIAIILITH